MNVNLLVKEKICSITYFVLSVNSFSKSFLFLALLDFSMVP